MRAVKLSVKKFVSVFAVLSLMVLLPVVGIGVNKAQAATISCDGSTLTIEADGSEIENFPEDQPTIDSIKTATTLIVNGAYTNIFNTLYHVSENNPQYSDFVLVDNLKLVSTTNITVGNSEHLLLKSFLFNITGGNNGAAGTGARPWPSIIVDAQQHEIHFGILDETMPHYNFINAANPEQLQSEIEAAVDEIGGDTSELFSRLQIDGQQADEYTPSTGGSSDGETSTGGGSSSSGSSNGGGSSYSGPTPFTDEIEAQLATAREFTVLNSDLANFQIDVKDLNLVPGEPIEAFVFSTPTYAGVVTPVDGIATFNLANLNLSAGTHTLAVVQPGTNDVKGKATVKVGNSAEAKIAKTAGNSAATGFLAFALILTAAFTTAATCRKNNA